LGAPVKPLPNGYNLWLKQYNLLSKKMFRVAETISIAGESVMRFRDGNLTESIVLSGTNPLVVRTATATVEVVLFGFERDHAISNHLQIYCKSSRLPSRELARAIQRDFKDKIQIKKVDVLLRTDDLFVYEWKFPWLHVFHQPMTNPPLQQDYDNSMTIFYFDED
jgi:hypothetical protein